MQGDNSTLGVKPMFGLTFYNFQFLYGYNFINRKKSQIDVLRKHAFEIRYIIPLFKFGVDKEARESAPFNYPSSGNYGNSYESPYYY